MPEPGSTEKRQRNQVRPLTHIRKTDKPPSKHASVRKEAPGPTLNKHTLTGTRHRQEDHGRLNASSFFFVIDASIHPSLLSVSFLPPSHPSTSPSATASPPLSELVLFFSILCIALILAGRLLTTEKKRRSGKPSVCQSQLPEGIACLALVDVHASASKRTL